MRRTTFALLALLATGLLLAFTTESCSNGLCITGSENYITKKVEVKSFDAIKLLGGLNITYIQDKTSHIEIYGSDNLIPFTETYVDNGTLIVKLKNNTRIRKGKLEIKVFSPELNNLTINGSGDANFANGIQTSKDIELRINGSGDIQGEKLNCKKMSVSISGSGGIKLQQVQSEECSAKITGSGDISLEGKTTKAQYSITGSGDIEASNLEAKNVTANITGSGDISCHASNKLVARITGSGDVAFKGNPQEIDAPRKKIREIK